MMKTKGLTHGYDDSKNIPDEIYRGLLSQLR
jgi:hypothetical protein